MIKEKNPQKLFGVVITMDGTPLLCEMTPEEKWATIKRIVGSKWLEIVTPRKGDFAKTFIFEKDCYVGPVNNVASELARREVRSQAVVLSDYNGNACLMSEKAARITAEKIRKGSL